MIISCQNPLSSFSWKTVITKGYFFCAVLRYLGSQVHHEEKKMENRASYSQPSEFGDLQKNTDSMYYKYI